MRNTVKMLLVAGLVVLSAVLNPGKLCAAQSSAMPLGAAAKLKSMNERFDRNRDHYREISRQMSPKKSGRHHSRYRTHRRSRTRHRIRIRFRRR